MLFQLGLSGNTHVAQSGRFAAIVRGRSVGRFRHCGFDRHALDERVRRLLRRRPSSVVRETERVLADELEMGCVPGGGEERIGRVLASGKWRAGQEKKKN